MRKDAVGVRRATDADTAGMLDVWRSSAEEAGSERRRELRLALRLDPDLLLLAELQDQIVGLFWVRATAIAGFRNG